MSNFFEDIYGVFEKAWMKSDTIILLGDFNCDLLGIDSKTESEIHPKTRRLLTFFQLFDMQNIVNKPTRITPGSSTLSNDPCKVDSNFRCYAATGLSPHRNVIIFTQRMHKPTGRQLTQ